MDWLVNDGLPLVARICLVAIFPFSGLDKIVNWDNALAQAGSSVLPGAPVLLVLESRVRHARLDRLRLVRRTGRLRSRRTLRGHGNSLPQFLGLSALLVARQRGLPACLGFPEELRAAGGLLLVVLGSDLVPRREDAAKAVPASDIVHLQAD